MAGGSALSGGPVAGYMKIDLTGLSALALNTSQMLRRTLEFTGALSADCAVTWPLAVIEEAGFSWNVINSCTGLGRLTCAGPLGAAYNVPAGRRTGLIWDSQNMTPVEFGAVVRSDESIVSGITGVSPTVVLTVAQANASVITLQGNATGSPVIQMPNGFALFVINNQLGVGVTVKTAGGNPTGTIASSGNKLCFIDNNSNGGNANTVG